VKRIDLDARELEHPQPLEQAMKILQNLDDDSYFYMLHRKNPVPLIDLAQEHHFQVLSQEDNNKEWHILISQNTSIDLKQYLNV
jgi:hypothetical protein